MQPHHRVKIAYADYMGETTERFFEPHTLVFCNNSWYCKRFCHLKHLCHPPDQDSGIIEIGLCSE